MELRNYQTDCVEAIWQNLDKHSVVCVPTGGGKSPIIAELIRRFLEYPGTHILLLTHKRELIRQNAKHLAEFLPFNVNVGIYCAGLRSKKLRQVTIASVQSIVKVKELPAFEIIIVDEAHLVPKSDTGQYHAVFARLPDARIIGLTATPYRLDGGLLHEGDERLFDALVYEAKTSVLIQAGWLSPIRARATSDHAELDAVHLRGGDYIPQEMIAAMDHAEITEAAVKDVLTHAKDRKSILVFCAGVEHAKHVEQAFRQAGQNSIATVTEATTMYDRDAATNDFKTGKLRLLINVGVYTTGFDAPNVDCIVLLRATKSPGLYVQIVGRGLRKAEGKTDCLLLDYGEHVQRFGPLDMITAKYVTRNGGPPPVRTCPDCGTIQFAGRKTCEHCGFVFPREARDAQKHGTEAGTLDPIKPTIISNIEIKEVEYHRHPGRNGKPDSMRVDYCTGMFERVSEWVCPLHGGYASQKAASWFSRRGIVPMPSTLNACIAVAKSAIWPAKITVRKGKYDEVIGYAEWQQPRKEPQTFHEEMEHAKEILGPGEDVPF